MRFVTVFAVMAAVSTGIASVPTTLEDFTLPGSQPNESGTFEAPTKCDNCHGDYDLAVEPTFNWRGSMMSQATRDPLFFASMTIANQDAPESGDLCIRCHAPQGWLEGRSTPTDGSALTDSDREGVHCDFCHRLVTPTGIGVNPYPDDSIYTADTYDADQAYLSTLQLIPAHSANGAYLADSDNSKRGPYVDADARHQFFYSPFNPDAALCGTCHDVSNPAFTRDSLGDYQPNEFDSAAPSFDPYTMFPVERTYSEWLMSDFNTEEGVYAPEFGGNKDTVRTCQDCHLKDVTGAGCDKNGAPVRDDLPLHDMTGGNAFIPLIIDQAFPGEADADALAAGRTRAIGMLQKAAGMSLTVVEQESSFLATVTVTNETGHKLPSGYPEGRRMWINIQAYDSGSNLIFESGAYDTATGVLTHDSAAKIYEIKPGLSADLAASLGLPDGPSFHFVLNNQIFSDNRIPPRGFTNAEFEQIQSPPVGYNYADGQYWDDTEYSLPGATAKVRATLYYQTTSKEYVEFLRDENVTDNWGDSLYSLWSANGKGAPVAMNVDSAFVAPQENEPPVLDSLAPQTVNENELLVFTVSASDPDGAPPALTAANLPTGAAFADNGDGTGDFSWTPSFDQAGSYNVTFYATDASGAEDTLDLGITVSNVNRPPELDPLDPQTVDENELLAFTVSASDPDGTPPGLTAANLPTGAGFTDNGDGSGVFSWTPTYDQAGNYSVTFYATDASGAEDTLDVGITVSNVNRPPELDPLDPQTVDEDELLTVTVTASDPDGTVPELTASGLPTGAGFTDNGDGSGVFSWTPTYDQAGNYSVTFYATDASGAEDTLDVGITVSNVNRPPELDPLDPQTVDEDELLTVTVTASDPDGTVPELTPSGLPTGAGFTDNGDGTGVFSWTPTYEQAGSYSVAFNATDDAGAEDTLQVSITVSNVNRPPELDTIVDAYVVAGDTLNVLVTASDPDGSMPSLAATGLPSNAEFTDHLDGTGTLYWETLLSDTGSYLVTILATDGELVDSQIFSIAIDPPTGCCIGTRGNVDGQGEEGSEIDISDLVYLTNFMFVGGPEPPCKEGDSYYPEADLNGDGQGPDISDLVYLVTYMFLGGPQPGSCP